MVCEKCEKKLGTVITPDTWKDGARNTTESGGRKLNENKALTSKKQGLILMERINSPLAEFVKVLCTNQVLITARAVPTKRASVPCVEKGFGYQKLQANVCLAILMRFLVFSVILLSHLNFQGMT